MVSSTFWSVFSAVVLAEVAKMIFERWIKGTIDARLDDIDSRLKNIQRKIMGGEKE
jgi:hypothetical protein